VYGSMVAPGENANAAQWQHRGYGEELLSQAEETARGAGYGKIAVISGIGVRTITGSSDTCEKALS